MASWPSSELPVLGFLVVVQVMLERVHPARPEWYEKFYATAMDKFMKPYEAEVFLLFP